MPTSQDFLSLEVSVLPCPPTSPERVQGIGGPRRETTIFIAFASSWGVLVESIHYKPTTAWAGHLTDAWELRR